MNATATKGTKRKRRKNHKVSFTCEYCGKEGEGTRRRKFCGSVCRSQHYRDIRHASRQAIEKAQFRALASIVTLGEGAKLGDRTAIKALREVDKLLGNISNRIEGIKHEEN